MGKIVVASSQFFLTDTAEILKADELKKGSSLFCFNGGTFEKTKILSVREVDKQLNKYTSSHGRILKTTKDTAIVKKFNSDIIELDKVYSGDFKKINNDTKGTVCSSFPIYGKGTINEKYIKYLTKSLTFKQKVRPHRGLVKQTIPRYLASLNKESLQKILKILFKDNYFKHLDEASKDLLILLCSRLGIAVNGGTLGHKATKQSGSLRVMNRKQGSTRKECITPLGMLYEKAYEIKTESETLLVGSILCQI